MSLKEITLSGKLLSGVESYSSYSGEITANYKVALEKEDGEVITLASQSIYIDPASSKVILEAPLSKDDIGKTPAEIMNDRIFNYLKENKLVIV